MGTGSSARRVTSALMKAPAHGQRAGVRSIILPDRLTSRPTSEMKWLRKVRAMTIDSAGVISPR
ncbi:hypothetical protein FEAC_26880 [Ferrimicrobium acidiphilum DSM 19497]|uniref:Uncharacterized protein n=1 Tax=Ferrimicrobium acidiphilum DSM 19497 TaxID=1121877 RepID=A0A0D8FTG3_9ACTN|nr:hypothetical protein FEAC_26880 [Ferrimicrobium acidiphilum DSM 19497]